MVCTEYNTNVAALRAPAWLCQNNLKAPIAVRNVAVKVGICHVSITHNTQYRCSQLCSPHNSLSSAACDSGGASALLQHGCTVAAQRPDGEYVPVRIHSAMR